MPSDTISDYEQGYSSSTGQPGILGATTQSGSGAYGAVPTVPDPSATQGAAISGNWNNLANLYGLAKNINDFSANQASLPYQWNLPGYSSMLNQSSQNILNNLSGVVSPDVVNLLSQNAAERGVSTGLGAGSANANTALLRALGLTSIGLKNTGEQELTSAIQRTPTGQTFNLAQWLTTPEAQQQAQTYANLYASQPNPSEAAGASLAGATSGVNAGIGGVGGVPNYGSGLSATGSSSGSAVPGIFSNTGAVGGTGTAGGYGLGTYGNLGSWTDQDWENEYNFWNPPNTNGGGTGGTGNSWQDWEDEFWNGQAGGGGDGGMIGDELGDYYGD
jgi:hypothetical protein